MPKKAETTTPNEEFLKEYGKFIRINSFDEFFDFTHQLPQQVAVWRSSFFHHFIYLSKTFDTEKNSFILEFVHKINKKPLQMAGSLLSMLDADFIARVAIKKVEVVYSNGEYKPKNGFSLLDLESGVYFLGDYNEETRNAAKQKALLAVGAPEIYSGQSCNCEHFSNWCFIDNPISYQANEMNIKAAVADAGLNACKNVTGLAVTNLTKQSVFVIGNQVALNGASSIGAKLAQIALSPVKSSAIGVIIQAPIEAASLTHSCLKMKKGFNFFYRISFFFFLQNILFFSCQRRTNDTKRYEQGGDKKCFWICKLTGGKLRVFYLVLYLLNKSFKF